MTEDTTTNESAMIVAEEEQERRRKAAILRAVGLEDVPPEQRELALAIANRYDLDLMLKHLVLIDGRPYITRDALLWVAHRSGHFDGIMTTEPVIKTFPGLGDCWWSEATVWRRDMSHPFTYGGRYPVSGQNKRYGPEMAIKVAECMSLRRAFNVSAPSVEERWAEDAEDAAMNAPAAEAPKSLAQLVTGKAAEIVGRPVEAATGQGEVPPPMETPEEGETDRVGPPGAASHALGPVPPPDLGEDPATWPHAVSKVTRARAPKTPTDTTAMVKDTSEVGEFKTTEGAADVIMCVSTSPYGDPIPATCALVEGHKGVHRYGNETWD